MTSYNDYIASKRLYTINNISNSCNSQCIMSPGPLYDGGASATGCGTNNCEFFIGPTGPAGDKYVSYFVETFYTNILFENGVIGIVIDKNLAYLPEMNIKCQTVLLSSETDITCFYGVVDKYDSSTGVIIIKEINTISSDFVYGTKRQYIINVDNTGPSSLILPTLNQVTVQLNLPDTYVIGLNDDIIVGNSITFASADSSNVIMYESTETPTGFVINDNLIIDNLYFSTSGTNNISYSEDTFTVSDNLDISGNTSILGDISITGNVFLGNMGDLSNSIVYAKLPQLATTLNSYSVRMAYTNISGIFQWQLFSSTSTKTQKANIETLPDDISILDIRPVTYNPISPFDGELQPTHIGFIAEEMAENEWGNYFVIRDTTGVPKSIQYDLMIPVYASAMRNLKTRVEELEKTIQLQEKRSSNMETIISLQNTRLLDMETIISLQNTISQNTEECIDVDIADATIENTEECIDVDIADATIENTEECIDVEIADATIENTEDCIDVDIVDATIENTEDCIDVEIADATIENTEECSIRNDITPAEQSDL